jgi:hypothetical protein
MIKAMEAGLRVPHEASGRTENQEIENESACKRNAGYRHGVQAIARTALV